MRGTLLKSPAVLSSIEFDRLIARAAPWGSAAVTFDLSRFDLITPGALTDLAAVCHHLHEVGKQPTIVVQNARVRSYLQRVGFIQAVRNVARLEPPMLDFGAWGAFERGHTQTLLQVTHLRRVEQLGAVLEQVWRTLSQPLGFPGAETRDLVKVVSELGQNCVEHGGEGGGFIAMQVYKQKSKPFLELAVSDYGRGILETLRENPRYRHIGSDQTAIENATGPRVSRFQDETRGTGLFHLLRLAERHRARVRIRSGRAAVKFRMDLPRSWKVATPWMPGVHVTLGLDSWT